MKHIYTIGILDFEFEEDKSSPNQYRYNAKLCELTTKEVFYEKLTFIYLSMPKFKKELNELENKFEKWLYVLKHLPKLERIPEKLKEKIFLRLFETAEIAKLTKKQYKEYEQSLNAYRDIKNSIDTAWEKGKNAEKNESAIIGLKEGYPIEMISKITGLSIKEIEELKKQITKR